MSKTIRVLLTEAADRSKLVETFAPNLGLGYLASYLRANVDGVVVELVERDLATELDRFSPHVLGISSVSQNYGRARQLALLGREAGALVVVGGPHISALPQTLTQDMDLAVVGEGEQTLCEIVSTLRTYGPQVDMVRWAEVSGLAFHTPGGDLYRTAPRPPIDPLDSIPFPDRALMARHGRYYHLISSRGCPYGCVFCSSTRLWGGVRFHSPPYVLREIEFMLDAYSPQHLTFFDDLFIASRERLRQIVALVRERGIHRRVAFQITARANLITEDMVDLLHRMNVYDVMMGLESGSERTLQYLKGGVSLAQNQRAVDLLHAKGIGVSATFVIGAPRETRAEILQTLDFIKRNPLTEARAYALTPLPGTPVWEYAQARGLVSQDMDWDRLDLIDDPGDKVILSETLTAQELGELYTLFDRERMRLRLRQLLLHEIPSRLWIALSHPLTAADSLVRRMRAMWRLVRSDVEGTSGWKILILRVKSVILGMR